MWVSTLCFAEVVGTLCSDEGRGRAIATAASGCVWTGDCEGGEGEYMCRRSVSCSAMVFGASWGATLMTEGGCCESLESV